MSETRIPRSKVAALAVIVAAFLRSSPAQNSALPVADPGSTGVRAVAPALPPSISLSPAVVMAKGNFGQALTQTLTLSNNTGRDMAFELVAEDVIVKDGKRIFVPAGELEDSIAATAVFTPQAVQVKGVSAPEFSRNTVLVKAYSAASADVHLTLPAKTNVRAVAAMFRGTDKLPTSSSAVGMTASLAALVTFNLSDNLKLEPEAVRVVPASETANMSIAQWISNSGSEPALLDGTAAVLNSSGALVGKANFTPQRLLPGERLEFTAEYPDQLRPGDYRVLCSFQFEGKTVTSEGKFKVQ